MGDLPTLKHVSSEFNSLLKVSMLHLIHLITKWSPRKNKTGASCTNEVIGGSLCGIRISKLTSDVLLQQNNCHFPSLSKQFFFLHGGHLGMNIVLLLSYKKRSAQLHAVYWWQSNIFVPTKAAIANCGCSVDRLMIAHLQPGFYSLSRAFHLLSELTSILGWRR